MIAASSFCALSRSGCPRVAAARDRSHDISDHETALASHLLLRLDSGSIVSLGGELGEQASSAA
jgi:hypothetical protein